MEVVVRATVWLLGGLGGCLGTEQAFHDTPWSVRRGPGGDCGSPYGSFGQGVAAAGDVDGDGYGDVIVASPQAVPVGVACVYRGSAAGLAPEPTWILRSPGSPEVFAWTVRGLGDLDGDGFPEVGVEEWGAEGPRRGATRIWSGGSEGLADAPRWTVDAPSVKGLGDVDGDGLDDVLVEGPDGPTWRAGSPGGPVETGWAPQLPDALVTTDPVGDLDGDGHADLGVSWNADGPSRGHLAVWLQADGGFPAAPSWTWSDGVPDRWVDALAPAGDLNGDGFGDLAVSAGVDLYAPGPGALVFLGGPEGPGAAPDWSATIRKGVGAQPAVSAAGDVDGDGRGDLLVASMTPDAEGGRAELYLGGATGPAATPAWRWEGHDERRAGGFSEAGGWLELAAAGDVDGDGRGDLVVGEPNWLGGPTDGLLVWGRVMVFEDALRGARPRRLW